MALERVTGPYQGYFIAAFSSSVDGGYAGHALICTERPGDIRHARPLEMVSSVGEYPDAEKAVRAAEYQARCVIDGLRPNWDPFTAPGFLVSN